MKPIVVISHERSGTHFCMNAIAQNFGLEERWIDMPMDSQCIPLAVAGHTAKPGIIRKSHHQAGFFADCMNELLDRHHVIYVIRDVRGVLVSCFHYFRSAGVQCGFPVCDTLQEFLQVNPSRFAFDWTYSKIPSDSMVMRWATHIDSWAPFFDRLHVVTYQELSEQLETALWRMAFIFGKKPSEPIRKPDLAQNTINPRRGMLNGWLDEMTVGQANKIRHQVQRHARWLTY